MGALTAHVKYETTVYVRQFREHAHAHAVRVFNTRSLFCFEPPTEWCVSTQTEKMENNRFAGQNKHGSLAALNVRK